MSASAADSLHGLQQSRELAAAHYQQSPPAALSTAVYEWCVIGAGPSGIAAVGVLLDSSVVPSSILWIDPAFAVGDFGTRWRLVSSNTIAGLYINKFYRRCKSFDFDQPARRRYAIEDLHDKQTCFLDVAAEPLRDITHNLRQKVHSFVGEVSHLKESKNAKWEVVVTSPAGGGGGAAAAAAPAGAATHYSFLADKVILATGAVPRSLSLHHAYPYIQEIPTATALNPHALVASVSPHDTIALFGSSHTAIVLLRTLLEQSSAKKVINFYRDPLRYALYMDDWILFDDTGLKGESAKWSRENLHGDRVPARLVRVLLDDKSVAEYLPLCTKVIYAIGFNRRELPNGIAGLPQRYKYNPHVGVIAPGLFGCGIGYPEQKTDRYGNVEMRVGLSKFMQFLHDVVPLWKRYCVSQGVGQPIGAPGLQPANPAPAPAPARRMKL